jgi:cytochrome c oxidase subunit 2
MRNILGLPPDWSATGYQIDQLIVIVHWFMLALFLFWGSYFVYALVRFRAGRNPKASYAGTKAGWSKFMEVGIVLFEIVLLVGFAFPLWSQRVSERPPEDQATRVRVVAEQFAWNFHYPGPDGVWGRTDPSLVDASANPLGLDREDPAAHDDIHTLNNLYLPVSKPAILYLSSKDVIHSFSLPYMRVKQDAIPGQVVTVSFEPVQTGDSEIACAQLCGMSHFRMRGFLHVKDAAEYAAWQAEEAPAPPPAEEPETAQPETSEPEVAAVGGG